LAIIQYSKEHSTSQTGFLSETLCLEWPPLWSSGQSSWLQIQMSGFVSRRYQIFWEVVGLERRPLSLVSTIEELIERKNWGSCLKILEYGRRDPSRWLCGTSISNSWN
jgi:hypothetical protein